MMATFGGREGVSLVQFEPVILAFAGDCDFLCNFYLVPITVQTRDFGTGVYPSVEHAFQAQKARGRGDHDYAGTAPTAAEAKARGRRIALRGDWESVRIDAMRRALLSKFTQHRQLSDKLRATAPAFLIEGNTWGDQFWGMTRNPDTDQWEGQNWLGRLLMAIRDV